jgi:hypothetical protein
LIPELLGLALALAGLNASLSYVFWTAPLPKKWKLHALQLYSDAITINFLVFSISLVQIAVTNLSKMLSISLSGPMQAPLTSFSLIMFQLGKLLASLLALAFLTSTFEGAEFIGKPLGLAAQIIMADMILWTVIYIAIILILKYWTLLYSIGILFYSIPFRLARKAGSTLMASACVLAIGLPLLPDFALMLEWTVGFQPLLENFVSAVQNPSPEVIITSLIINPILKALIQILAAIILSLIIFPVVYLWILSKIIRRLSQLIGGYSRELDLARWIEG